MTKLCLQVFPFLLPYRKDGALANGVGQVMVEIGRILVSASIAAQCYDPGPQIAALVADVHHQSVT